MESENQIKEKNLIMHHVFLLDVLVNQSKHKRKRKKIEFSLVNLMSNLKEIIVEKTYRGNCNVFRVKMQIRLVQTKVIKVRIRSRRREESN